MTRHGSIGSTPPRARPRLLLALRVLLACGAGAGLALAQPAWDMRVCADPNRLPYSSRDGSGYDNRIAAILADELGANLVYVWTPLESLEVVLADFLHTGACDLILGVQDGEAGLLGSAAYYRSPFAFVQRAQAPYTISSFDAPELRDLRIGVLGAPAHAALLHRGLDDNVVPWDRRTRYGDDGWLGDLVRAVAEEEIDVAVLWGPIAGYFAERQAVELTVTPVPNEVEPPFVFMVRPMTIGLRPGDQAFRDRLDIALARRWDEVQAVLGSYQVPLSPLPRLIESVEGR